MLVEPQYLFESLRGHGGAPLENLLHDLLMLEGQAVGLGPTDIDWDHRTNRADGGRDLVVRVGCNDAASLIPDRPSIWSSKSGADAAKGAGLLQKEIEDHPDIIKHLEGGGCFRYVVLHPCDPVQRDALRTKADEIARAHDWPAGAIGCVFDNHLCARVSAFPTLIPHHLPALASRLGGGATSASQWLLDQQRNGTPFVRLDSRRDVLQQVTQLLSGEGENQLVHIAGWSGVGKSRLVAEATATVRGRESITVYQRWEDFETGLLQYLRSGQVSAARIVVDEVDTRHLPLLAELCRNRLGLRIVSIGTTDTSDRIHPFVQIIDRPTPHDLGVLVESRSLGTMTGELVKRITDLADGDCRLAEMLYDAASDLEGGGTSEAELIAALRSIGAFLDRYLHLNASAIGDPAAFREALACICMLADVGFYGSKSSEIDRIASFVGKHRAVLDQAVAHGIRIGLCREVGELIECVPRPLATHLFESAAWPLVHPRLSEFYENLGTERARRAFLRRLAYCGGERRREVERRLGHLFRERFADATLADLADADTAATLRGFVETLPHEGLTWLNSVIGGATLDELKAFRGSTGMFGSTYGRREIVWLCEQLRSFADCFVECESILYRLALGENEQLGNNATAEWARCFWWVMSGTEVPFSDRVSLLIRRLQDATDQSIDLLLKGIQAALHEPVAGSVPPEFVAGRLTPPEWRPTLWSDVFDQWSRLREAAYELARTMQFYPKVSEFLAQELELFVQRGLDARLRDEVLVSSKLKEGTRRQLRRSIERLVGEYSHQADEVKSDLRVWLAQLAPHDLREQLRDVVGRDVWEHERMTGVGREEAWRVPYDDLAQRLCSDTQALVEEVDWLESDAARSPRALGAALVRSGETEPRVRDLMLQWLREGRARELVLGYFVGLSERDDVLPDWAIAALDEMTELDPSRAIEISVEADVSVGGIDRVFHALGVGAGLASRSLGRLFGPRWNAVLSDDNRRAVLDALIAAESDQYSIAVGLDLITMWYHRRMTEIPETLDEPIGHLVALMGRGNRGGRAHEWKEVARWWGARHATTAAGLLVDIITCVDDGGRYLRREAEELLRDLARSDPDAVAAALDVAFADERKRLVFHVLVFRGLFEKLGLERIERLVNSHGEDGAAAIARHLPDPNSSAYSELVDQFLARWGSVDRVFRAFLLGRHSGRTFTGYAFDRKPDIYERTAAYLKHTNPQVRKWAEWERAEIDRWAERDRRMVDEMGRD